MLSFFNIFTYEIALFAAVGFLIGGIDDLVIDCIWALRSIWRRVAVYSRHSRANVSTLAPPTVTGPIIIFVAAWDEHDVIGKMLAHAIATFDHANYRIYVGCYPNDPQTIAAVGAIDSSKIRLVVGARPGPTTKADCLNTLWRTLCSDESTEGFTAKAVVLHDAEDIVHSAELRVFDTLIERFTMVQLPVMPLPDPRSRWVAGHYCDEFAEAHGKTLVIREALGANIPAAGVGCALSRDVLARLSATRDGDPFDPDTLTEDYEIGLGLAKLGGRGAFVRLPRSGGTGMVSVRAHFPATLDAAVRQKARWIAGIALLGWDRLGWQGGIIEGWMRLHDRRALIGALILLTGYLALVLAAIIIAFHWIASTPAPPVPPMLAGILSLNGFILLWRLAVRSAFSGYAYGWREALRAIPRAIVGNIIAILAARRALFLYMRLRRDGVVRWDKTTHAFPTSLPAE